MRFLLSIALLVGLMKPIFAQDSTSFWKHLSVEGDAGIFSLNNRFPSYSLKYDQMLDGMLPIRGEIAYSNGVNYNLGVIYSFRPNHRFRGKEYSGFFILGLNTNLSSFGYNYKIYDDYNYYLSSRNSTVYSKHDFSGKVTPIEINFMGKYLFRAGRVFFGPNISVGAGKYIYVKPTEVGVVYTSSHVTGGMTPPAYDTSRYTIELNNYFGTKKFNTRSIGLILGVRLGNFLLYTNDDLYFNDNYYRYFRMRLGLSYFF